MSASAYAAARDYWPAFFQGVSTAQEQGVMQGLRATRPVLVRGYESMVMVSAAAGAGVTDHLSALLHGRDCSGDDDGGLVLVRDSRGVSDPRQLAQERGAVCEPGRA